LKHQLHDLQERLEDLEITKAAVQAKLRVYDQTANPFYTDYSPVRLISAEDHRLNDDEYQVTVRLSR
jgi:hypothetical protein